MADGNSLSGNGSGRTISGLFRPLLGKQRSSPPRLPAGQCFSTALSHRIYATPPPYSLATSKLAMPLLGAHWVLTGCSLGARWMLAGCSLDARWELPLLEYRLS